MASKKATLAHVKGFILNKLFEKGCTTSGQAFGKHMPVRDLRTGYDPKYHGVFPRAIDGLKAEGLIRVSPARTGRSSELHAAAVRERLGDARAVINAYRRSVKLRPLRRNLMEV